MTRRTTATTNGQCLLANETDEVAETAGDDDRTVTCGGDVDLSVKSKSTALVTLRLGTVSKCTSPPTAATAKQLQPLTKPQHVDTSLRPTEIPANHLPRYVSDCSILKHRRRLRRGNRELCPGTHRRTAANITFGLGTFQGPILISEAKVQ